MFLYNLTMYFQSCVSGFHSGDCIFVLVFVWLVFLLLIVANCFSLDLATLSQVEILELWIMHRKKSLFELDRLNFLKNHE